MLTSKMFTEYTEGLAEETGPTNQPVIEKSHKPLIDRCRPIAQQCRELLMEEVGDRVVREIFNRSKPLKKQCVLLLHDLVQHGEVSGLGKLVNLGQMSCIMKKPAFCIRYEKNKGTYKLYGNLAADQCFYFRNIPSLYFLNPEFQASSHLM